MAGVFYKKVKDVLYRQTRTFGSDALNSNGIDRSGYAFSGITNGGDGRIFGFEAAAQLQLDPWTEELGLPEWMGGFGISAQHHAQRQRSDQARHRARSRRARCGCPAPRTRSTTSAPITRSTACRCGSTISAAAPGWTASPMI